MLEHCRYAADTCSTPGGCVGVPAADACKRLLPGISPKNTSCTTLHARLISTQQLKRNSSAVVQVITSSRWRSGTTQSRCLRSCATSCSRWSARSTPPSPCPATPSCRPPSPAASRCPAALYASASGAPSPLLPPPCLPGRVAPGAVHRRRGAPLLHDAGDPVQMDCPRVARFRRGLCIRSVLICTYPNGHLGRWAWRVCLLCTRAPATLHLRPQHALSPNRTSHRRQVSATFL